MRSDWERSSLCCQSLFKAGKAENESSLLEERCVIAFSLPRVSMYNMDVCTWLYLRLMNF